MKPLLFLLLSTSICLAQYESRLIDPVISGTTTSDSYAVTRYIGGDTDAAATLDLVNGGFQTWTLTADATFTLAWTGAVDGRAFSMTIRLQQDDTGGWTGTWPAAVIRPPDINPTKNSITHINLQTTDNGVTVYAFPDYATGVPITNKSGNATTTLADANTAWRHPSTDDNPRTFTIDSNANVPCPIGTTHIFMNEINTVTISITTDTLTLQGANTTGSRTLAAGNTATAVKVSATKWIITGSTGLTYWLSPDLIWVLIA